jgi:hypothetical protein
MKLKIRNVGPNDFGFYRCVAKNSLGKSPCSLAIKNYTKYRFPSLSSAPLAYCRSAGETDGMIKLDGESAGASHDWRVRGNK